MKCHPSSSHIHVSVPFPPFSAVWWWLRSRSADVNAQPSTGSGVLPADFYNGSFFSSISSGSHHPSSTATSPGAWTYEKVGRIRELSDEYTRILLAMTTINRRESVEWMSTI